MNKFFDTFEKHKLEPDKTIGKYIKESRVNLGEEISPLCKIYLDTNFWLELRDVILGTSQNSNFELLYNILHKSIKLGKVICPISSEHLYELFLQTDPKTLYTTVNLIDDFSKGVALLSPEERIQFEIYYFIQRLTLGEQFVYEPDIFIWTKVAYANGTTYPTATPFPKEVELIMQKAFFDNLWAMSLIDIVNTMGMESIVKMPKHSDITNELNINKLKYANENSSFKQIFLSEIAGVITEFRSIFEECIVNMYEKLHGSKPTKEEIDKVKAGENFGKLIYHIFKRNKLATYLPSLVISSGLHASIRQDTNRKYKHNDMADFRHAQAALPYYDYFFTEHSLRDLIKRSNLNFTKRYNCIVESEVEMVIEIISRICN